MHGLKRCPPEEPASSDLAGALTCRLRTTVRRLLLTAFRTRTFPPATGDDGAFHCISWPMFRRVGCEHTKRDRNLQIPGTGQQYLTGQGTSFDMASSRVLHLTMKLFVEADMQTFGSFQSQVGTVRTNMETAINVRYPYRQGIESTAMALADDSSKESISVGRRIPSYTKTPCSAIES